MLHQVGYVHHYELSATLSVVQLLCPLRMFVKVGGRYMH